MTLLRTNTPLEDHLEQFGLLVKREDRACAPPGPPFSKTRGVFAHVRKRYQEGVRTFGVLDTYHSQAGHAVAAAVHDLNEEMWLDWGPNKTPDPAHCVNFYPVYKADPPGILRPQQEASIALGAELQPLPAGRSAILYHAARKATEARGGYCMPNALKLPETVEETAAEVVRTYESATTQQRRTMGSRPWLIACSSATIAAGVLKGILSLRAFEPKLILHMGYSRSRDAVMDYVADQAGIERGHSRALCVYVDEGYAYKDQVKEKVDLPFPANHWYDAKAASYWLRTGRQLYGRAVFWLIG